MGSALKYFEMTHYSCVTELWTYLLLTATHNIQSRIKQATCFGLLSHHQALIKNIKKTIFYPCSVHSEIYIVHSPTNALFIKLGKV